MCQLNFYHKILSKVIITWDNTQPWEIAAVGGQVTQSLTDEFCQRLLAGQMGNPDFSMPTKFSGRYNNRVKAVGKEVFTLKGIGCEDHEAR